MNRSFLFKLSSLTANHFSILQRQSACREISFRNLSFFAMKLSFTGWILKSYEGNHIFCIGIAKLRIFCVLLVLLNVHIIPMSSTGIITIFTVVIVVLLDRYWLVIDFTAKSAIHFNQFNE